MRSFTPNKWLTDIIVSSFAEFLGTFLFVFMGCGSVVTSDKEVFTFNVGNERVKQKQLGIVYETEFGTNGFDGSRLLVIAIAHGLIIAGLVSATAGISGGHLNPAFTFALMLIGRMPIVKGFTYIISQFTGAILGAGLLKAAIPEALRGTLGAHSLNHRFSYGEGVLLEIVFAFTVMIVFYGTAVNTKRGTGNTAPIALGFTVAVDHLVGVPLTGASMNPARSLGPAVWTNHHWHGFWLYFVGPVVGCTLAAVVYTAVFVWLGDIHSVFVEGDIHSIGPEASLARRMAPDDSVNKGFDAANGRRAGTSALDSV